MWWDKIREKMVDNVTAMAAAGVVAALLAIWGWARSYVGVEMPIGAVVAFALDDCPQDGKWTAFNDANGRSAYRSYRRFGSHLPRFLRRYISQLSLIASFLAEPVGLRDFSLYPARSFPSDIRIVYRFCATDRIN
jgi:hypothetical protein